MLWPRLLVAATGPVWRVPARGKALQGWRRPSIGELGVPSEPWARVHERNQRKFTLQLLTGLGVFSATLIVVINTVVPNMNTTPHHLMK